MSDPWARAAEDSLHVDDYSVPPDESKLSELLLLAAEALAEDPFAGAIKVNKVMFFAEFAHVRLTSKPITGAPYQKLKFGPAPRRLRPVRDKLIADGAAELVTETILGREKHRLQPLRPARRHLFSETELRAVDEAAALLRSRTGSEASELSHQEPGWQLVDEGETVPFVTAFLDVDQKRTTPAVRARAQQVALEYAERSPDRAGQ